MNINPGKTEFSQAEYAELRREVRAIIDAGTPQTAVSREAEVPSSSLSQFLSDSYPNETGKASIAGKLTRWLKARADAQALRSQIPEEPEFMPLQGADRVTKTLQYAYAAGEMVLIGGVPGTCKTWACRQFAHDTPRVWFTSMDPTTRGVPTMLLELLAAMGEPDKKGTPQALMRLICGIAEAGKGLIIVDEAQHLSDQAVDTLRAVNDRTRAQRGLGIGIAVLGNELAQSRVAATGSRPEFAQVSSRFARRVWLKAPDPRDAATLAQAWAHKNGEEISKDEIAFAQEIATRPGGLRNVEKVMRGALLAARGAEQNLTVEHLKGAWRALSDAR